MENKQTAVEWLEDELAFFLKDIIENKNHLLMIHLFEQAKAMEKWQIVNAHWNGGEIFTDNGKLVTGEMYYNETYGN